jgi:hypothetical protein
LKHQERLHDRQVTLDFWVVWLVVVRPQATRLKEQL